MEFEPWYKAVDRLCQQVEALGGLGIDDLPDWPSHDLWSEGLTPEEALCARFDVESLDEITHEVAMDHI